jgi:hypothetical protein
MPPSLEFQVKFCTVEPGDSLRQAMPGNISEDRVMRPAGVGNLKRRKGQVLHYNNI